MKSKITIYKKDGTPLKDTGGKEISVSTLEYSGEWMGACNVSITIENDTRCVYRNIILFAKSFADVYVGEALAYVNSLDCMAVAINQGSFARAYNIGTGNSWRIRMEPFRI